MIIDAFYRLNFVRRRFPFSHTQYDRRSHRYALVARRVISGERRCGTPATDDDRWWIARIKETGDREPADFPRRKAIPLVRRHATTGGDRTGLSVINYPIVRLSARRYRQHTALSPMILSLSRVTRAECITVISRRIARKHRSRAKYEREREREQVCASLIRRSMRRILRKCFESSASEERCRASFFLSRSRESFLIPLERRRYDWLLSRLRILRLSGRDGYSLISRV